MKRAGMNNRAAADRSMVIMRVLLGLFPLNLMIWNSTEALPVRDKLFHTNEILTNDQKDLLKTADVAEMNITHKELEDLEHDFLNGKLGNGSVSEQPVPKDKSPCKLFFWKTFSSC